MRSACVIHSHTVTARGDAILWTQGQAGFMIAKAYYRLNVSDSFVDSCSMTRPVCGVADRMGKWHLPLALDAFDDVSLTLSCHRISIKTLSSL